MLGDSRNVILFSSLKQFGFGLQILVQIGGEPNLHIFKININS